MIINPQKQCPICQEIVDKDALVCPRCGYSLLTTCAGCGSPVQIQYSYCPYCSRPLHTNEVSPTYIELKGINEHNRTQLIKYANDLSRLYVKQRRLEGYLPTGLLDKVLLSDTPVVGERRYLTVLFSDVVGFTQLSANLDPEEVFLLMNSCFRLLVEQVYKYGGSVDKFIGDALMALFGAPIAHGNDSERAVRAAIGMQNAIIEFNQQLLPKLGQPLELRIGITSGDAIAGTVGVEGQWSYTVMGSTVNMASRLQAAANPGGILVNEDVYHQTKGLIKYKAWSPIPLKGIGNTVPVFEVVEALTDTSGFQQLPLNQLSPFVGRQSELARLDKIIASTEQGSGWTVFVTGEAGLGKTRLMWEWRNRLPTNIQVWPGFAKNLLQGSYDVWRQIILQGLRLHKAPHQTVVSVLLEYLGDETWLPFLEVLLFGERVKKSKLTSLKPEQLREQIFIAVAQLLSKVAVRGPLVIMLDNLQWADQLSRELLQSLFTLCVPLPIIFCVGSRSDSDEETAIILAAKDVLGERAVELALPPLSTLESKKLLTQLLSVSDMPGTLQHYVLNRANNNPHFLEELVHLVVDSGIVQIQNGQLIVKDPDKLANLRLPNTLRELVRAQLDRLPEIHQQILSYGAVIGTTFSAALAIDVLRHSPRLTNVAPYLTRLVQQGILTFDGANYHFVHNVVPEVIYHGLLSERRRQMHQQVGEAIESRRGAAGADVEQLAYHFTEADNPSKAVPYLIEAGNQAKQRFANDAALRYFTTALKMLSRAPEYGDRRAEVYQALGALYQHRGDYDQALTYYQQALDFAATPNQRTEYKRLIGQIWQWKGDSVTAQHWFEQALQEMSRWHNQVSRSVRGRVYADMALMFMHRNDYVHAERWGLDAVSVLEEADELGDLAKSLNALGGAYYFQHRWQEASQQLERAQQIQKQIGDRMGLAGSFSNLGMLYTVGGQWDKAIDEFTQAIALCEELGALEITLGNAHNNIAFIYLHQGKLELAETHLQQSLAIKDKTGSVLNVAETLNNLALSRLLAGNYAEAESYINQSIDLCKKYNEIDMLSEAMRYLAEIHLAAGKVDAAVDTCQQTIVLANKVGSKISEGAALRMLARAYLQQNKISQAKQAAQTSLRLLTAINHAYEAACTQRILAEVALAENDSAAFEAAVNAARPLFERLQAQPELKQLEALHQRMVNVQ